MNDISFPHLLTEFNLTFLLSGVSNRIFSREMQELRTRCDKLAIMVNKIYNCVCPVLETANENDGRGMPKLPNSSFSEIVVWEEFLKDHDNALHVVSILALSQYSQSCLVANLRSFSCLHRSAFSPTAALQTICGIL